MLDRILSAQSIRRWSLALLALGLVLSLGMGAVGVPSSAVTG